MIASSMKLIAVYYMYFHFPLLNKYTYIHCREVRAGQIANFWEENP